MFNAPHCVDNQFFADLSAPHQTLAGRIAAREFFGFEAEEFVVLFVGKLEIQKRPFDLIRAGAKLGKGISILIVGTGELEDKLREESKRLTLKVSWTGFLNQTE